MKRLNKFSNVIIAALLAVLSVAACGKDTSAIEDNFTPVEDFAFGGDADLSEGDESKDDAPEPTAPVASPVKITPPEIKARTVGYIRADADGVYIRSGAGTQFATVGTTEESTLYACMGEVGEWYKTSYKNKTAYINKRYCTKVELAASDDARVEAVIDEGSKLLGVPYIYGAVRLHDGNGAMLKGFSTSAFDCSSLMQYAFYKGANKLLGVTTRTQVSQGSTVVRNKLKRGDLIFFTNASRKNNVGIERVGHVALYLGDNWILHTASDYAKIEQVSATRWGYYIQTQRVI